MLRLAGEKEELAVVDDQTGSPTWTADLSLAIKALIDSGCRGTYHAVNSGCCSWFEFAEAIFSESGSGVRVKPLFSSQLNRPAPRPLFSVLDCCGLAADTGLKMEHWRDGLRKYLRARREEHGNG